MGVREEMSRIPKLKNMGLALIDYVESLHPGIAFELKGTRWVPPPLENFIAINQPRPKGRGMTAECSGQFYRSKLRGIEPALI